MTAQHEKSRKQQTPTSNPVTDRNSILEILLGNASSCVWERSVVRQEVDERARAALVVRPRFDPRAELRAAAAKSHEVEISRMRGGKGQTARSGSSIRIGFEGGQMPLIRRIPKRGFNNAQFTTAYSPVNVSDLNQFEDGARVDETALRTVGLANGPKLGIKILGNGELTKKLAVVVSAISASAKTKIEAKGGSVEIVSKKPAAPAKA